MKLESINLRRSGVLNEKWVQEQIAKDPAMLGLGDLLLKDKERIQPNAGRLDLLLVDPDTLKRYEVEIQLGATDEALSFVRSNTGISNGSDTRSTSTPP